MTLIYFFIKFFFKTLPKLFFRIRKTKSQANFFLSEKSILSYVIKIFFEKKINVDVILSKISMLKKILKEIFISKDFVDKV